MNLKKVLESIPSYGVIIKAFYNTEEIFFTGKVKDVPKEFIDKGWIVGEAKLSNVNNYNSDYILTVY